MYFSCLFSVTRSSVCCETANSFLTVDQKVIKVEQLSFRFHVVPRYLDSSWPPQVKGWRSRSPSPDLSSHSLLHPLGKGFLCVRCCCGGRTATRKTLRVSSPSAAGNRESKRVERMKRSQSEKMGLATKTWEWGSRSLWDLAQGFGMDLYPVHCKNKH